MSESLAKKHFDTYKELVKELEENKAFSNEDKDKYLGYIEQTGSLMILMDILATLEDIKQSVTKNKKLKCV